MDCFSPLSTVIIGLGYVGEPLLDAFSKEFKNVQGYDIDTSKVVELRKKYPGIVTDIDECLKSAKLIIVCLPTPLNDSGEPDISALEKCFRRIAEIAPSDAAVVLESTVWPGCTEEVLLPLLPSTMSLYYSPERVSPGDNSLTLKMTPKLFAKNCKEEDDLYNSIVKMYRITGINIVKCDSYIEAEYSKMFENVQRDVNIAICNEFAMACHNDNVDFNNVLFLAGTKPNFCKFQNGFVGGHCIGVDTHYMVKRCQQLNTSSSVMQASRYTNELYIREVAMDIVKQIVANGYDTVVFLGKTYKPNVADTRESGAEKLIETVSSLTTATVYSWDPYLIGDIVPLSGKENALFVIATHHDFFLSNEKFKSIFKDWPVYDTTGEWKHKQDGCLKNIFENYSQF